MEDFEEKIKEYSKLYALGTDNPEKVSEAFSDGATSDIAKQYWKQGMYSEEEVKRLCSKAWLISPVDLNDRIYRFDNWFE